MDGRDFSLRLKKIKAEVLALKQAHAYGLNRTDFDSIFIEEEKSARRVNYKLVIKVDTSLSLQPYIELTSLDLFSFNSWDWNGVDKEFTITGSYYNSIPSAQGYTTAISLVSTKPIISYEWEEI